MSKIIRNSRVVSQTGYYKDLEGKPSINGHILEEIGNTSKNLDIFVTIPKAEYEDDAFEPNVQTLYAVIDEDENVRVHFFNQNPDAPVEYILHDYREVDELPAVGDETVLYYVNKSYRDDDTNTVYRMGLWGWVCVDPEEEEYEWRSFTDTKVDDLTIHNYESLSTQVGGYIKESFETEDIKIVNNAKPIDIETDGTNTTLHLNWSEYNQYTPNTKYSFKITYRVTDDVPALVKEGEITPHGVLPDFRVDNIGAVILQKPEITMVIDGTIFQSTNVDNYKITITWAKPKDTFVSRINPLFIPHDSTIKVNEEGKLSVGGNSNAYAAINKVGDYLYDTYYSGLDYGYAEQYFKNKNSTAGFCSLMRSGNLIGRNYDMVYSELCDFIVHTPNRTGRFATAGVASGLKELTKEVVESGKNSDDYKILPFQLVDGINEKGVFAAYNMVPTDKALTTLTVPDVMEKKVMCALQLVRFVVDNFETALEAVEYIRDYVGVYMTDEMQEKGYEVHLTVMDKDDSYIVEFIDNKNIVQNIAAGTYMTNFYQTDAIVNFDRTVYTPEDVPTHSPSADNNITEHGAGLERYNIMARAFNPIVPFTSKTEMWDLMNQLNYTNAYTGLMGSDPWGSEFVGIDSITVDTPIADIQASAGVQAAIDKFNNRSRDPEDPNYGTWHTMHSCVYDVVNTSLSVASQEGSEEYTYELPKTSEEDNEIRLSEISDETIDTSQNATLQLILDGIFNENKTFIINYNDEEKILTNSTPMRDDHGVYLPFSGSPHGDYTLLRVYYDVPTKLVMGCKRYQMLPVMYSLMDIAEGSPLATNCIVAVCDDFRKITFSAPNPFKIGLKDGWKGDGTVQYSFNKQDWFDWDGVSVITPQQNVYDVYEVHFRGVGNTYIWKDDSNVTAFSIESAMKDVRVKGNVVYMLDYETDVPETLDHIFQGLFSGGGIEAGSESGLYDATDLTLPFTSLGSYSYKYMFENCVNLINGPQIPAIEAKVESCMGMFKGCKMLEECPTLPATVLGDRCYAEMFMGCETITETPVLAAQILKPECYMDMFNGCIALETCPVLPAVMFAIPKGAYKGMFKDCTAITTMPVLEATMLEESAYEDMFNGCTALANVPNKLPAMALAKYCYKGMFTNCNSLVKMPQLPAKTMQPYCYQEMFANCGNLEKLSELPIDMTAEGCCQQMFLNCPKITKPLDLPSKVLAKYCYKGMFQNCSGITWLPSGKVYKVPSIGKATSSQISAGWNTDMFKGTTVYCDDSEAPIPIAANAYYYTTPEEYLTFACMNAGGVTRIHSTLPTGDKSGNFCYSLDKIHWRPFVGGDTVSVNNRGVIYFCGRITEVKETYGLTSDSYSVSVSGNIKCMSSISQEIWEVTQPDVNYAGLFNGMTKLCFVKSLVLIPEYTSDYMYQNLFKNTEIIYGPTIPTTTNVAAHAYENMFYGCVKLCEAPFMTFPETDIHEYAYRGMFRGCKELPKVPQDDLPGVIDPDISQYAYAEMFMGCEKIKYCATMPTAINAPYVYSYMYSGTAVTNMVDGLLDVDVVCEGAYQHMYGDSKITHTNYGDLSKLSNMKIGNRGFEGMFINCDTIICEKTEEIKPVSFGERAFQDMFSGCKQLKVAPITFSKDVTTTTAYCCKSMYKDCVGLIQLPKLYPTVLAAECYREMFRGCTGIKWNCNGSKYRVPWKSNATSTGSNAVLDMFTGTGVVDADRYDIPGSEVNKKGTPQIFVTYYYNDPDDWVTFTSDKTFKTKLSAQYKYYNEVNERWESSTTTREVNAYNVNGTYTLKVAGYHTAVTDDTNDNPITMTGEGWVKASGKITSLMGYGETDGSWIFAGNTRLKDITELDLTTAFGNTDFNNAQTVGYDYRSLFNGCTGLTNVPDKFPFTKLVACSCYNMFRGCTSLTKTYDFSSAGSVTLTESCFNSMYCGCTGITKAPKLPWTTATKYCYAYMFQNCTKLTTVEGMSLTKAYYGCCYYMFAGCTSLKTVPTDLIKVTTLGSSTGYEFSYMFDGCTSFNTTLVLKDIPLSSCIYYYMFRNTALVTPPYLPQTTLSTYCYYGMFYNCSKMTSFAYKDKDNKFLPATTLKQYCYYTMYYGCSKIGDVPAYYIGGSAGHPTKSGWPKRALTLTGANYCLGYMFAGTNITSCPEIIMFNASTSSKDPTKDYPTGYLYYTFYNCTSLTNTSNIKTSGYDGDDFGYLRYIGNQVFRGTFKGCTGLTTDSNIVYFYYVGNIEDYGCYEMYRDCTSLTNRVDDNWVNHMTLRTIGQYGCAYMFYNCSKITRPYAWCGDVGGNKVSVGNYGCYYMYGKTNVKFCDMGGKFYINSTNLTAGTNAFYGMFQSFTTISGGSFSQPDSNGTVSKGTTYYFADSPINMKLTYNNTVNNESMYVTIPTETRLFYSTDEGQSWTRIANASRNLTLSKGSTLYWHASGRRTQWNIKYTSNAEAIPPTGVDGILSGRMHAFALDYVYGTASANVMIMTQKFDGCKGVTDALNVKFPYRTDNSCYGWLEYGGNITGKVAGYFALFRNTCLRQGPYQIKRKYWDPMYNYTEFGIFDNMFYSCAYMTKVAQGGWDVYNSNANTNENTHYNEFRYAFCNCNSLIDANYISGSKDEPWYIYDQGNQEFQYAFHGCMALTKNPIPTVWAMTGIGPYEFHMAFALCYCLDQYIVVEKLYFEKDLAGAEHMSNTYNQANIPSNLSKAKIYLLRAHHGCKACCYAAAAKDGKVYDIQITFDHTSIIVGECCYQNCCNSARVSRYTPVQMTNTMVNNGRIYIRSTSCCEYMFSGINGAASTTTYASINTMFQYDGDGYRAFGMYNGSWSNNWGPFRDGVHTPNDNVTFRGYSY